MLTAALMEAGMGRNEKGQELNLVERGGRILETFEPGVLTTARKVAESAMSGKNRYGFNKPLDKEIFNLTGLTIQEYDINKSLPFAVAKISNEMKNVGKKYTKLFNDYRGTNPNKFLNTYNDSQEVKYRAAQDLYQIVKKL
mgnify:FL=1